MNKCIVGSCLDILPTLEAGSVQTCVTSPPYWGLRDYGTAPLEWNCDPDCDHDWNDFTRAGLSGGLDASLAYTSNQIVKQQQQQQQQCNKCAGWRGSFGMEPTPQMFVNHCVQIFREVRRVLKDDGTLWVNFGDSYCGSAQGVGCKQLSAKQTSNHGANASQRSGVRPVTAKIDGVKTKDLVGIPWMVAFALRADGWYLRQDIIWHKPNPMPESVRDRCTKAHEYIFLLSKSERYYFDADAIAEPLALETPARVARNSRYDNADERAAVPYQCARPVMKGIKRDDIKPYNGQATKDYAAGGAQDASATKKRITDAIIAGDITTRNKRSVWTVTTKPFSGAHFATFPPDLIEPCILAGSKPGDVVLDPFGGSGTTGMVAEKLGRQWVLIELNPAYAELSRDRTAQQGMVLA